MNRTLHPVSHGDKPTAVSSDVDEICGRIRRLTRRRVQMERGHRRTCHSVAIKGLEWKGCRSAEQGQLTSPT